MTKRLFSLGLMIILATTAWADVDFGNQATVSTTKTWVFNDLTDTYSSLSSINNDYYLRVATAIDNTTRTFTPTSIESTLLSFADGYSMTVTKKLAANGTFIHNDLSVTTAGADISAKTNGIASFAFNAEVAGTVYVKIKWTGNGTGYHRIYFNDGSKTTNVTSVTATSNTLEEISYTSTKPGSFFIGTVNSGSYEIYAVRFVPTEITVSEATTWDFNNFTAGNTINSIINNNGTGLFMRNTASTTSTITANTAENKTCTFSDGTSVTATNYLAFGKTIGANAFGNDNDVSPWTTSGNSTYPSLAFKATVPGTLEVFASTGGSGSKCRIYFSGSTKNNHIEINESTSETATKHSLTETTAGTYYISAAYAACNIYAVRFIPTHSVTAVTSTGEDTYGTVSATSSTVAEGATTTITAEPATGYQVSNWAVSGTGASISPSGDSNSNTTTLTMGTADATVTCTFAPINYDITVNQPASGGSFTVKVGNADAVSTSTTANYNQTITLENTPIDGFVLSSYSVTKTASSESITVTNGQFTMPNEAVTITATFVEDTPAADPVPVIIVAGQSNTDGRAMNDSLPQYIRTQENNQYPHVYWSYGNGTNDKVTGTFDKFWPACDASPNTRWAYDAVVYYHLQQTLNGSDLYVIKESKGGTAINTSCSSTGNMWWSADETWLSSATSADADGQSLLLALKNNIDQSLTTLANANKTADIKFLMWHQGEADKGNGTEYQTQLQQVINYIRTYLVTRTGNEAYADLPVILGGIKSTTAQYSEDVETAKQAIATADANIYYVSSEDFPVSAYRQDNLHFNFKGAELFGKRVYDLIVEHQLLGDYTYATKSTTNYPPVISFNSETGKVTIENDADSDATGGTIYYTTNGSTPTSSSTAYSEPFSLTLTSTVKAISIKDDLTSFVSEKNIAVPSPAVTYDFAAGYTASETFTLPTSGTDDKTTVYYYGIAENTPADAGYGFYHITSNTEKMPVNGRISWKAGSASLVDGGMKCTSAKRYFAIHNLCEGDKIRIVFTGGTIKYAKHSSKGDAITGLNTSDEITSDQEYTVSSVDTDNNYVVFYPTNGTIISQIYINVDGGDEPTSTPVVHMCGDSMMSIYGDQSNDTDATEDYENGMRGWGQYFGEYVNLTVQDWAHTGTTAKGFYGGANYWKVVMGTNTMTDAYKLERPYVKDFVPVKAGDYVIMCWGHNDQKGGELHNGYRTLTESEYTTYITKMVNEVKAIGAYPILATSICRSLWSGKSLTRLGKIDACEAAGATHLDSNDPYNYPEAMRNLATTLGVPCIDLNAASQELWEEFGPNLTGSLFFPNGGTTHTSEMGARAMGIAANLIIRDWDTTTETYANYAALKSAMKTDVQQYKKEDYATLETTVTTETTWTFEKSADGNTTYSSGDVIANALIDYNGLYIRATSTESHNAKAAEPGVSSVTFNLADEKKKVIPITMASFFNGTTDFVSHIPETAGVATVSNNDRGYAINTSGAGTLYASFYCTGNGSTETPRYVRISFDGTEIEASRSVNITAKNQEVQVSYHANKAGTFCFWSEVSSQLLAVYYVPDADTSEDEMHEPTGETISNPTFTINGSEVSIAGGTSTLEGATITTYYKTGTESTAPEISSDGWTAYSEAFSMDATGYVYAYSKNTATNVTSAVAVSDQVVIDLSAAVIYDFMAAYAANNAITPGFPEEGVTVYYNRDTDASGTTNRSGTFYPITVNNEQLPVNSAISCFNKDQTMTEKGLKSSSGRPFAIHNLKAGDVIRIEFDGGLYYAKSTYSGGKGNALEGLSTGDVIKNIKAYTVSSIDAENNYVVFNTSATTTISQISINKELTMKYVPKPTVSTAYTENEGFYTYTISYQEGATLHYTLPGGTEQTKAGGESLNVNVTKIGDLKAYATLNAMTSETASQRVYAPTPAIASGGVYDFALVKETMLKDYKLGTLGYGDAVTIGGVAMKKPDAVVAKTLDCFAFTSEYTDTENEQTKDGKEWLLLSAGRLRANATHDNKMAILNVKQGQYLTITYKGEGAVIKYSADGSAKLAEGTDVLTSDKGYEIKTGGDLLLTIPANAKPCDIYSISLASTEIVSAPTIEAREEINKVTLRLGTSNFGKTVTAYYTIDGSTPTTSSTAVTKNGAITVDESCTMKAYCVSETGVASGVTEYKVSLPAASKSASVVYDWQNLALHSDTLKFATDGLTVYDKEYDSTKGWETKKRTDFLAATNLDSKVSVRNGYKGLIYDKTKKTIRLTKPLAIHNLAVDDEIVIIYTGDGSLYSGAADEGDVFTVNGKAAPAGTAIPSGATIKVTKEKYENNYVVVTPSGPTSGKVYISAIYINHASPTVVNIPKAELASVDLDRMTSTYRFTFDEGAMLYYKDTKDNEVIAGSNTGTFDLVVAESAKLKAWEMNGTLVSDTLSVTVYAPTPAPSTTGNFDFSEASEDLPADIEVTLDASNSVTVGGETLYKPSALTAATFGDKFAFTETGSSNKIRIRTNHHLMFAKGTNMSMGLLNLKKGDIIAFNYTGSITFADPSQVSVESPAVAARAMTRTVSNDMTSGTAYVVQADGNILLNLNLTEESTSISKMYIAAAPTAAAPAAIDFATASENYEEVETGSSTSVYVYGKSSAQTFKRLVNSSDELPIDGMISTEAGSGEITADGIKAANRHIAIHNLAAGDKITISFFGGALTYGGHETYGNRVSVDGKTLAAQDTLTSGDVMVVEKVDYLNNYVVLKLDSKCCISGIFINRDEDEKVWAPTIIENGKNTVLITAGRSSLGYQVTTYYTTDGTDPSDRNGIGGPYDSYDVELLDGSLVPVKAISYSSSGKVSNITTFNIFADMRTEIIGVSVEDSKEQVIYDLQGRKVETPMEGRIYIIDGKKKLYRRK